MTARANALSSAVSTAVSSAVSWAFYGRRRRVLLRRAVSFLLAAVLALGVGFGAFVHRALQAGPAPPQADGIVVLTGGADRVAQGLHLLAAQRADRLLISGVGPRAELPDLARLAGMSGRGLARRVTLGRDATSTIGNATETATWARRHDMHSLIIVTAGYHMPRAMMELGRAMPGITLYPAAVQPPALRDGPELTTLRLLGAEYAKWLGSLLGLSRFLHLHGRT